jgi:hypothetical protein
MSTKIGGFEIPAVKDEENERPIPTVWRPVIREIVNAFVRQDYHLKTRPPGVAPISDETAIQIKNYVQQYGETLVELSDETWETSVCVWTGSQWEALVDLWTLSEGRSDLVLSLDVSEGDSGFLFEIYMVYVP